MLVVECFFSISPLGMKFWSNYADRVRSSQTRTSLRRWLLWFCISIREKLHSQIRWGLYGIAEPLYSNGMRIQAYTWSSHVELVSLALMWTLDYIGIYRIKEKSASVVKSLLNGMVTIFRVYVSYMYSLLGIYLKFLYTLMLFGVQNM